MKLQHLIPTLVLGLVVGCVQNPRTQTQISGRSYSGLSQAQVNEKYNVCVQFLGMTNDAAGTKLASFELLNLGMKPLIIGPPLDTASPYFEGGFVIISIENAVLDAGSSLQTSISVPRSPFPWHVGFLVTPTNHDWEYKAYSDAFPPNTNGSLTVEQATSTTMRLANDKASTQFQTRPSLTGQPAKFVAGHWQWVATQGFGHGDIQAKVELASDGSTNSVNLELLDNRIIIP